LIVRLKADAPAGYIKDQLTLVTNDSGTQRIPLYVEGRVVAAVTVSPASLAFGDLKPGQEATKTLIVSGKKPFKVTAVECDDPAVLKFKTDDASAAVHRIPVTFKAPDKPGKVSQTIRIKIDGGKDIAAQCQGWAKVVAP
jgi:hypothetical protein